MIWTRYYFNFNTKLRIGEDWEYWARAAWAGCKFGFVNEKLVFIRYSESSVQYTTNRSIWKDSVDTLLNSFLKFPDLSKSNKGLIYKRLAINSYYYGNSFKEIMAYYFKAIVNMPFYSLDARLWLLILKYYPKRLKNILKKTNKHI